jgi:hypothetical protein
MQKINKIFLTYDQDTICENNNLCNIRPIDVNNKSDIKFTYEILKKRSRRKNIDFTPITLPTIKVHADFLKKEQLYKHFLIVSCLNIDCMVLYVKAENYEIGAHMHPFFIKQILKQDNLQIENALLSIKDNISNGKKLIMWGLKSAMCMLIQSDLSLKDKLIAYIRSDNEFSILCCQYIGFKKQPIMTNL